MGMEREEYLVLKQWNRLKATREAEAGVGRVASYPQSITLTMLERCNYDCVMCTHQVHSSRKQISWEGLRQLEAVLPFTQTLAISGGEPLLYDRLDDFIRLCHAAQCAPLIQTNGSLLKAGKRRYVVENQVLGLKISCDGATPETYERIRRGGSFANLVGNIQALNRLKEQTGSVRPYLEFNFVAMRSNIEELPRMALLASRLGVMAVNVFLLVAENEEMARESLYFHQDLADEQFKLAVVAGQRLGVDMRVPPLFRMPTAAEQAQAGRPRCTEPWRMMTVNVSGEVAICCGGAGNAGNLNTDSFEAVWNHPKRVKVRETVNTDRELPCCRNCRQGKPQPDRIAAHIPDPELARRMLQEHGLPVPGQEQAPPIVATGAEARVPQ